MWNLLGNVLSPPTCAACDALVPRASQVFCGLCARAVVSEAAPRVGHCMSYGSFGGPLAAAIRRFKYGQRPDLARPLGHLLRQACRRAGATPEEGRWVVPVPLHPRRLAERGYNQAALLAAHVAVELGAAVRYDILTRELDTPPQAALPREDRWSNVERAFRVHPTPGMSTRHIVLIDDVSTTGATLAACTQALRKAGSVRVSCLVVAQTEGPAIGRC